DSAQLLSFAQAQSVEEMQKLDGKRVTIIGYMSTLSPVSGKFMYLMNLPYQSCPFCIPNTTQLSNTIAVYAKSQDGFEFTDRAIRVTGILDFDNYTDEFGYEYSYRIKDATYTVLDTSDMPEELRLWQQLASTDVISEVYSMFDYVSFLCHWTSYTAQFQEGKDYLYPSNALYFIETEGAQFNYGFRDGYFDKMIGTINEVDPEAFAELTAIVERAKALAGRAYGALKNGDYYTTKEYDNVFGDGRLQYKMNDADSFAAEMNSVFASFSSWLADWEI
ncbi:MAG: hypothetical protein IJ012_07750, partial [Clostridia bacterium]|nr:hypothetical protein [Clostridia bacterium]